MLSVGCGQTQAYRCTNRRLSVSCTPRHSTWVGEIWRVGLLCPTSWPNNMQQTSVPKSVSELWVSVKPHFGCRLHNTLWCTPEWSMMHPPIHLRASWAPVLGETNRSESIHPPPQRGCSHRQWQTAIYLGPSTQSIVVATRYQYTTSGWFSTSLSAALCSHSLHSMAMMTKSAKKHQKLSSAAHPTEKYAQKTKCSMHTRTFPTCCCVYMQ